MLKLIHAFFNMDTNSVELTYNDGSVLTIDCEEVENAYDVTNGQMADLDWLLYNAPMEYASPAVRGNGELPERSCPPWNRRLNSLPVYRGLRYTGLFISICSIDSLLVNEHKNSAAQLYRF